MSYFKMERDMKARLIAKENYDLIVLQKLLCTFKLYFSNSFVLYFQANNQYLLIMSLIVNNNKFNL